jgi:HEAT repeat protein
LLAALSLDTTDVTLRTRAIESLGLVGRAGQDAPLLDALGDEHPQIRLAAALSLRKVGAARSAQLLLDRLERLADQDRGAVGLALAGPLSVTTDGAVVERVERLVATSEGKERSLLVEALGAVPGALGGTALTRLSARGGAIRAKVVEALAQHPEAWSRTRSFVGDPDASVRANAVWALGSLRHAEDAKLLAGLIADRDPAVAGNAVAAFARVSRGAANAPGVLCGLLTDSRPYVRTNALAGLFTLGKRCARGPERTILVGDRFDLARATAARLVSGVASTEPALDRAALTRCVDEDTSADVAAACKVAVPTDPKSVPVSVYVVPAGESSPVPLAPFALVRADGFVRLGISDERGSVYEHDCPRGVVRLAIPAALAM